MNKFIAAASLALAVSATPTFAEYELNPVPFEITTLKEEKWLMANDTENAVSIAIGYNEGEQNCTKLSLNVLSWFPASDMEEQSVSVQSAWLVDNETIREQKMEGRLVSLEKTDLFAYSLYIYKEFIDEMIRGKFLYYMDETYIDSMTTVDLNRFQEKLSEVLSDCLNRGGKFEEFNDKESSPVRSFPKTRA